MTYIGERNSLASPKRGLKLGECKAERSEKGKGWRKHAHRGVAAEKEKLTECGIERRKSGDEEGSSEGKLGTGTKGTSFREFKRGTRKKNVGPGHCDRGTRRRR